MFFAIGHSPGVLSYGVFFLPTAQLYFCREAQDGVFSVESAKHARPCNGSISKFVGLTKLFHMSEAQN